MAESRCSCGGQSGGLSAGARETVCIDTMRVLDSCRDKDCYERVRVYLTRGGQDVINRTATVRTADAKIIATSIVVDDVPFNRGFYQINIRFYIRLQFEACVGGGQTQEFRGLGIVDKTAVLFGGEGCVHIFRSSEDSSLCNCPCREGSTNKPVAVVETVEPVVLGTSVVGPECGCGCASNSFASNGCGSNGGASNGYGCGWGNGCGCGCNCCADEASLPGEVMSCFGEGFAAVTDECKRLLVSIGMFSVIRLERPAQYLVSATEYAVPDKECRPCDNGESPCDLFRAMSFPVSEFYPPSPRENGRGNK